MSNGLPAEVYTKQRDESMSQAVKGLFLINGGAALALVAFLKDVWEKRPADGGGLTSTLLWTISCLVVGVALAGLVHLLRYVASSHFQSGTGHGQRFRIAYLTCAGDSLLMFVVAMAVLMVGLWLS